MTTCSSNLAPGISYHESIILSPFSTFAVDIHINKLTKTIEGKMFKEVFNNLGHLHFFFCVDNVTHKAKSCHFLLSQRSQRSNLPFHMRLMISNTD